MDSIDASEASRVRPSGLAQLALWAQRRRWPVPSSIKRIARKLLYSQARNREAEPEGWSSPLIVRAADPHVEMPGVAEQPAASPLRRQTSNELSRCNSRLRCLVLTHGLDAGGIDEFVAFLARRLPSREIDTVVMVTDPASHRGRLIGALRDEGIQVITALREESCRWLADNRPDVISAHVPPDWALEASRALNIPVVETLHAVPTPMGTDWRKEGSRSRNVRLFIACSELVRRQYLRGNPEFNEKRILTVPNGYNDTHRPSIDRAKARAWLGLEDEFLFISLGRHVLQKNGYGLIAAFAEVAAAFPQAHLVVAGRMDDRIYMEQMFLLRAQLQMQNKIHLRDNLANPSALFAAADAFVMNSFFEGWSLASMEALCAGLPVVMSDVGGAREQVGLNGERGYVVPNPAGDPEMVCWESAGRARFRPQHNKDALVHAMSSIITDRERWAAARAVLAKDSRLSFSVETCVERYAQLLETAAAR